MSILLSASLAIFLHATGQVEPEPASGFDSLSGSGIMVPADSSGPVPVCLMCDSPAGGPGWVEAIDGMHYRGGQAGEVALLLDGVRVSSPLSGSPLLLVPRFATAGGTLVARPGLTTVFPGLSGSTASTSRSAEEPGISGNLAFGTGSIETGDMEPLWHPSLPSHESRPLLEDCYTASGALEGATSGMLPGLTSLLLSGDFVSSEPFETDENSWRDNWDNNAYDSWSGLAKLGWTRSQSFGADLTFALHERERGWSDWAWSRYEDYYIDSDTLSSTFGDTLAGGVDLDQALPTRFDEGSLMSLSARIGLGGAGELGLLAAQTGSHVYDRVRDADGGYVGDEYEHEDEWLGYSPPGMLLDAEGFIRSGVCDLLRYDFEDDSRSAGLSWNLETGGHALAAGTDWILHDMTETSVTLLDSQTVTSWRSWAADPVEGAFYARDRIDLSNGLGITAGLRLGIYDPNFDFTEEPYPVWPGADTGGPLPGGSLCTAAPSKKWLDPSISIVQQIAGHCRITLEYARRSQMPRTVFMYSNADSILLGDNPFVGNPDLDPERTVDISLGFDRVCPGRGEMGITLFYRTMDDLVTTETRQDPGQGYYRQFANGATATVRGLEISQHAGYSDWLAWSVSYTLSRAEGSWSVLQEDQEYVWTTPWISGTDEFPLDWDRRHSLETSVSGEFPERSGIAGGLGAGLTWTYASGFPFDTSYYDEAPAERNTGRYPDATRLDASVWRRQSIGGVDLTLRLDVVNLSQERNIAWIVDPEWYLADGSLEMNPTGPLHNSHAFGPPRHFFLGLSVGW